MGFTGIVSGRGVVVSEAMTGTRLTVHGVKCLPLVMEPSDFD
jgi:hypothetical protein